MRVVGVRVSDFRSLRDVQIPLGTYTVLLGPNGAGKSTLLEAMGLDPHGEGEEERADDPRPRITWYVELDECEWEQAGLPFADGAGLETWLRETGNAAPLAGTRRGTVVGGVAVEAARITLAVGRGATARLCSVASTNETGDFAPHEWFTELIELPGVCLDPVIPVTIYADADDVTPYLTRDLLALVAKHWDHRRAENALYAEALDALERDSRLRPVHDAGLLEPLLHEVQERASALLPDFVRSQGRLVLTVERGPDSPVGRAGGLLLQLRQALREGSAEQVIAEEARAALDEAGAATVDVHFDVHVVEPGGAAIAFSHLGRGTRRWIVASLREACRVLLAEAHGRGDAVEIDLTAGAGRPISSGSDGRIPVFLVDEPAQSLHPRAQPDVLEWLEDRVCDGGNVVLTSHSPLFLRGTIHRDDLLAVGVYREESRTRAVPIRSGMLRGIEELCEELGIPPDELLLLARALLLVEGDTDLKALQAIFGRELHRRSIVVHPVGGSDLARFETMLEGGVFQRLRLPLRILLDKTTDPFLDQGWQIRRLGDPPPEQCALRKIVDWCRDNHPTDVVGVAFAPEDIICGFAEETVNRAFPNRYLANNPFRAWPKERAAFIEWCRRDGQPPSAERLKIWFKRRVGEKHKSDKDVVEALVGTARPGEASVWLRSSWRQLLDSLADVENSCVPGRDLVH